MHLFDFYFKHFQGSFLDVALHRLSVTLLNMHSESSQEQAAVDAALRILRSVAIAHPFHVIQ